MRENETKRNETEKKREEELQSESNSNPRLNTGETTHAPDGESSDGRRVRGDVLELVSEESNAARVVPSSGLRDDGLSTDGREPGAELGELDERGKCGVSRSRKRRKRKGEKDERARHLEKATGMKIIRC